MKKRILHTQFNSIDMNEFMPFKNSNHSNYELIFIPVTVIHNHIFFLIPCYVRL